MLLLLFLGLFFYGVYGSFQSVSVALLALIILAASLWRYFIPLRYAFYGDRLVVRSPFHQLRRPWSDFRSFYVDRNGVLLSPFIKRSRLENFRGVYVRFGENQAEVIDFIERKVADYTNGKQQIQASS